MPVLSSLRDLRYALSRSGSKSPRVAHRQRSASSSRGEADQQREGRSRHRSPPSSRQTAAEGPKTERGRSRKRDASSDFRPSPQAHVRVTHPRDQLGGPLPRAREARGTLTKDDHHHKHEEVHHREAHHQAVWELEPTEAVDQHSRRRNLRVRTEDGRPEMKRKDEPAQKENVPNGRHAHQSHHSNHQHHKIHHAETRAPDDGHAFSYSPPSPIRTQRPIDPLQEMMLRLEEVLPTNPPSYTFPTALPGVTESWAVHSDPRARSPILLVGATPAGRSHAAAPSVANHHHQQKLGGSTHNRISSRSTLPGEQEPFPRTWRSDRAIDDTGQEPRPGSWKFHDHHGSSPSMVPTQTSPLGMEAGPRVIVMDIAFQSLAHRNGVKAGDEILAINDVACDAGNCKLALNHISYATSVRLSLRRDTANGEQCLLIVPLNCGQGAVSNVPAILRPPHLQPSAFAAVSPDWRIKAEGAGIGAAHGHQKDDSETQGANSVSPATNPSRDAHHTPHASPPPNHKGDSRRSFPTPCSYCGAVPGSMDDEGNILHFRSCARCRNSDYCSETCQRKHWSEGHRLECVQDNSPSKTSAPGAIDQRNVNGHGKEELSGKDGPALLPSPIFRRDKESRDGGERLPSPKLSRSAVSDWANGGIEKKYHSGDVAEGGHKMGAARSSLSLPPSERQHLTYQELDAIFRTLDHKHNGYITHSELIAGLRKRPWAAQKMGMPDHVALEEGTREFYELTFGTIHDDETKISFEELLHLYGYDAIGDTVDESTLHHLTSDNHHHRHDGNRYHTHLGHGSAGNEPHHEHHNRERDDGHHHGMHGHDHRRRQVVHQLENAHDSASGAVPRRPRKVWHC